MWTKRAVRDTLQLSALSFQFASLFLAVCPEMSITKVAFMQKRAYLKDAASLVASGPRGYIHLWNVFSGGALKAQFPGVR
jgi:hypothetical protein